MKQKIFEKKKSIIITSMTLQNAKLTQGVYTIWILKFKEISRRNFNFQVDFQKAKYW